MLLCLIAIGQHDQLKSVPRVLLSKLGDFLSRAFDDVLRDHSSIFVRSDT